MAKKSLGGIDLVNSRIVNLADPSSGTDAANKQYVDNVAAGLNWKANVKAASTANMTIASAVVNGASMDGVSLVTGDRVLLKNQTTASENGIYIVAASGAASRATDADTTAKMANAIVRVAQGTVGADTMWQMVTDNITLGTTALTWTQFSGGSSYTPGNGIQISGGVITAVAASGGGLSVVSGGIQIDSSVVVRKYATTIGDGSATSIAVTHNLGTKDITYSIQDATTGEFVDTDAIATNTNVLTLSFATAPASNKYRVVVHG